MAFYVYILKCANGKYYTGHTDNLEKRIGQHQSGAFEGYTSEHLPVTLMWTQDFPTRYEALDAEMKIKGWSQAKKEALIKGDWGRVSFFAKPPKKRLGEHLGVSTGLDTNGSATNASRPNSSTSAQAAPPFVSSPVEAPIEPDLSPIITKPWST